MNIDIILGLAIGILVGVFIIIPISYEKGSVNKLLIKEQCAEYNSTTGKFVIHNLLKVRK